MRSTLLLLSAAAGCAILVTTARAEASCPSPPIIGCTSAQGCNPPVEPFLIVEPFRIKVQYHDQCAGEDLTIVRGRVGSSGAWQEIQRDGANSGGWRTATWNNRTPNTNYCFQIVRKKGSQTLTSAIKCKRTPVDCPPPIIGFAGDDPAAFPEVGTGHIDVQYHDQCGQEDYTRVYRRNGTFGPWFLIQSDGHDSVGWRTAEADGLKPDWTYCFKVVTTKWGISKTSSIKCKRTNPIEPVSGKLFEVADVGNVGSGSGSTAEIFQPTTTGTYRIRGSYFGYGGPCPGVVVADSQDRLIGIERCGELEVALTAGRSYQIYLTNGRGSPGAQSRCSLWIDEDQVKLNAYCGWQPVALEDVAANIDLVAVHLPPSRFVPDPNLSSAFDPPRIRMTLLTGHGPKQFGEVSGTGVANGAYIPTLEAHDHAVVLIGFEADTPLRQPVRLALNDANLADSDGDGLGDGLEASAGTCRHGNDFTAGFDCSRAHDPWDTDADGIPDDWELLGRPDSFVRPGGDQPLPYWGADPRHKDLFLEIDFAKKKEECEDGTEDPCDAKLPPESARIAASAWGFENTQDPSRRETNADQLDNPDGQPGIRLHIDSGVPPETVDDWTLYGDWGGHTVYDLKEDVPDDEDPWVQPDEVWDDMAPIRYGIFRPIISYPGDGGQAKWGPWVSMGITGPVTRSAYLLVHEVGHSFGLDHGGPFQLESEVPGYDPEGGGLNCKPLYRGIMPYSADSPKYHGFADDASINFRPMNNTSLIERGALFHYATQMTPESKAEIVQHLREKYEYLVDESTGDVDWNRDGIISDEPVRAGANIAPRNCDQARINRTLLPSWMRASRGLSLAPFEDQIHAAWVDGQSLGMARITVQRECSDMSPDACMNVASHPSVPSLSTHGLDLEAIEYNSGGTVTHRLALVSSHLDDDTIRARLLRPNMSWTEEVVAEPVLPDGSQLQISGEPDLVFTPSGDPAQSIGILFFRDAEGFVYQRNVRIVNDTLAFGPIEAVLIGGWSSSQLRITDSSSPAGLHAYPHDIAPWNMTPSTPKVLHLFAADGSSIAILQRQSPGSNTYDLERLIDGVGPVTGRPSPVWVTYFDDRPHLGTLFVYNTSVDQDMYVSRGQPFGSLSNPWWDVQLFHKVDAHKAAGIAAIFRPGIDEQPRLLIMRRDYDDDGVPTALHRRLWLRPRAESIFDTDYYGYNDWLTLKYTLCPQVAELGDDLFWGSPAVDCAPYPARDQTHERGL